MTNYDELRAWIKRGTGSTAQYALELSRMIEKVEDLQRQLAEKSEVLREVLTKKAADIRTEYETAWGKPCDCRTANSALYYGRAQGLEIAATIVAKHERKKG